MTFKQFNGKLQNHFQSMLGYSAYLFEVNVDKDELYNLYLDSFPDGSNEIYKKRREHDCSCCKHFIRSIGNVVAIRDNKVVTLWDFQTGDEQYQTVVDAMSAYLKNKSVTNVFLTKESVCGTEKNYEDVDGKVTTWNHLFLNIPNNCRVNGSTTVPEKQGEYRNIKNVFKRSLEEVSEEAIKTVLELISQNSLYRGAEWKSALTTFLKLHKDYQKIKTSSQRANFCWVKSIEVGPVIGKIRNHSIGTLLVNITQNMSLDMAVKKYEDIVAGPNYKRPKPIFTKQMLEDAQKTIDKLGYMESLGRRHANLDDITVNNILFSNRDSRKRIAGTVFDDMLSEVSTKPKKFDRVETVEIEKFIHDILPTASEIELYFENRHAKNMVSLIAPQNKEAPTMFKWNNGFGWAYAGNIADSNIKEEVKTAGGKVDGDLRFSIQWNEDGRDNSDLDAHCKEADGFEIYYGSAKKPLYSRTKGQLDIDVIEPRGKIAVENITWADRRSMKVGTYKFFVHMFSGSLRNGFRAEIEFDGNIYSFDYSKPIRCGEDVMVAEVILDSDGKFTMKELLPSNMSSKEIWGINTSQFVPVSVIMYSPNYWDEQRGIGNKHYFFMLKNCANKEIPNGFYNEFLKPELCKHSRVFEALGSKLAVEYTEDQLSGVGFSSTLRNNVIVKVKGSSERVLKITF